MNSKYKSLEKYWYLREKDRMNRGIKGKLREGFFNKILRWMDVNSFKCYIVFKLDNDWKLGGYW